MQLLAFLIAGRAQIQDYTEPSTDLHSAALRSTRHDPPVSNAGIPVIAACTKADLVDDNTGLVGASVSEIGDMAKGYGREWEVGTNGNLQILRTICRTCVPHLIDFLFHFLFFFTRHRSRLHSMSCKYALHVLFVPSAPTPNNALDDCGA